MEGLKGNKRGTRICRKVKGDGHRHADRGKNDGTEGRTRTRILYYICDHFVCSKDLYLIDKIFHRKIIAQ